MTLPSRICFTACEIVSRPHGPPNLRMSDKLIQLSAYCSKISENNLNGTCALRVAKASIGLPHLHRHATHSGEFRPLLSQYVNTNSETPEHFVPQDVSYPEIAIFTITSTYYSRSHILKPFKNIKLTAVIW